MLNANFDSSNTIMLDEVYLLVENTSVFGHKIHVLAPLLKTTNPEQEPSLAWCTILFCWAGMPAKPILNAPSKTFTGSHSLCRSPNTSEVGSMKLDPATMAKCKLTRVAMNRHSSGTNQSLNMAEANEERQQRSERNRTRQTAAAGPPRLPAAVSAGTGSTSLGRSNDSTTSQGGVAAQDSERSDTVGQRTLVADPSKRFANNTDWVVWNDR